MERKLEHIFQGKEDMDCMNTQRYWYEEDGFEIYQGYNIK
jgi:hypothetical protein